MRNWMCVMAVGAIASCSDGSGRVETPYDLGPVISVADIAPVTPRVGPGPTATTIKGPDDIGSVCETATVETLPLEVAFPAVSPGCGWEENGNLQMSQGVVTARVEQVVALEIPEGGVICDLQFDFTGIDPSFEQVIIYDDNFFLTFNDVVLAASYGPMVEPFEVVDGLPIYNWRQLRGYSFSFQSTPAFCLGEEDGLSQCTIPDPEEHGTIALSFGGRLVDKLSFTAVEEDRFDFMFVTIGDNDPGKDCAHDAFQFTVNVSYAAVGGE